MDNYEIETFCNKTESLVSLVSRLRREHDETFTNFQEFKYLVTRPGPRLLEKINKLAIPWPRLINNQNWSETKTRLRVSVPLVSKPRWDRESRYSLILRMARCAWDALGKMQGSKILWLITRGGVLLALSTVQLSACVSKLCCYKEEIFS